MTDQDTSSPLSPQTAGIHGGLVLHPSFFTLSFSPDGRRLVYLAEQLPDTGPGFRPYTADKGGLGSEYKVYRPM